jgi:hypothetical protein
MGNDDQIIQETINWTPEIIVGLVGETAWPVVILIIAWRFKESIASGIKHFFDRNNPTEVSVGAGGVTARFEASKQTESIKTQKPTEPLPEGQDAESIKQLHTERSTKYSLDLLKQVQEHVAKLEISDQEKIELLSTEVSILQANFHYIDITTVLFLSQYNLFNKYFYPQNIVAQEDIDNYFKEVKNLNVAGYEDWDVEKYLAYPLSNNLLEAYEDGYRLTKLGTSYVIHIRNNPGFLDYLAKL